MPQFDFNSNYAVIVEVVDNAGDTLAQHLIAYDNRDNAFRAYGHAVQGHNVLERDQRRFRQVTARINKARAEDKPTTISDPDRHL